MADFTTIKAIMKDFSEDNIQSVIKRKKTKANVEQINTFFRDVKSVLVREQVIVSKTPKSKKSTLPTNRVGN